MLIYGGIDEAGYGPMFGPMVIGRAVLAIPNLDPDQPLPDLWRRLSKAVCKTARDHAGRIPVNDSKKLHTSGHGLKNLETGVLAFAALAGRRPATVAEWLDSLGESCHHDLAQLRWYHPDADRPWAPLPWSTDVGELAIARGLLTTTARRIGVECPGLGAAVVFEDRFNRLVAATRSKAAASFTFVAAHLRHIWDHHGLHHPVVVVDRQSGRTHYREPLAMVFPEAAMTILEENPATSVYRITDGDRSMRVSFEVDSELRHLPTALASMVSKYTRELLMARFQAWFTAHAPEIKPTAGYALDAQRFWREIEPRLPSLSIRPELLKRMS